MTGGDLNDHPVASWLGPVYQSYHADYGANGDLRLTDWTSIPIGDDTTPAENWAEWWNMAGRATSRVDGYVNQVLRATIDTELMHGPDYRVTVGPAGGGQYPTPYWGGSPAQNARLIMSRWPILSVTAVQTCPNNLWPRQWTSLPAGYAEPELPPLGVYGGISPGGSAEGSQAILVGGGYINWCYGRNGWAVQVTYINGYPHCSLTSAVEAGATSLPVNDTTGWGIENYYGTFTGATGRIVDSGNQESVHVTATSVTAGPGNLTVSAITYPHPAGTVVTTIPSSIEQACILFCVAEALTRGATTTTIHDIGGHAQQTGGDIAGLVEQAEMLCQPFRRTI
jgi:hypothetical protein